MSRRALRTVHVDALHGWGGGQVQLLMLARGLAERGHAATLVCQPRSALEGRGAEAGLPVVTVRMRHDLDVLALLALARLFRRLSPDIVHLHSARAHTLGSLAARRAGVAVVASRRTAFPPGRSWVNRRRYTRWVDRVIAISIGAQQAVVQAGVAPPEQVTVIHSAVDCARFRPADRARARVELGLPARAAIVGCVGRIEPEKGQHVLVEAAARVVAARGDALFALCGEGAGLAALKARAAREGLGNHLRFLGQRHNFQLEGGRLVLGEVLASEHPAIHHPKCIAS